MWVRLVFISIYSLILFSQDPLISLNCTLAEQPKVDPVYTHTHSTVVLQTSDTYGTCNERKPDTHILKDSSLEPS